MEAFYNFISLLRVAELSWGWYALLFFICVFLFFALITVIQMFIGAWAVFSKFREISHEDILSVVQSNSLPPITFIIPAFNESKVIAHTVRNLLTLSYRYKKIIIVNDGSTDDTLEVLKSLFSLRAIPPSFSSALQTARVRGYYVSDQYPDLLVIDKENGNKADALNAGLNACETEIFVAADADTLVVDDALNRLIRPFLLDPKTVVAHASIGLLNGCKIEKNRIVEIRFPRRLIAGFQAVDYIKSFLVERMGLSWTKGALVVPGNFGLFKKDIIVELGGYDTVSLVEDTEIITHMHEYLLFNKIDYKITYVPDLVAWTAGPDTVEGLVRQRLRWYKGTTQNILKYRRMWFNPRYRSIGLFICPMTVFEKVAPLIEIAGFVILLLAAWLSTVDWLLIAMLAVASWMFISIMNAYTLLIDAIAFDTYRSWKDLGRILKVVFVYFGYHYILLYCRIKGLYVPKKARSGWTPDRINYGEVQQG